MNISIPDQKHVLTNYGTDIQPMIHAEECAELIQAISKMRRAKEKGLDAEAEFNNLVEEMADVLICMEQIKEMYGIFDSDLQEEVNRKCRRQEERMRNGKSKVNV